MTKEEEEQEEQDRDRLILGVRIYNILHQIDNASKQRRILQVCWRIPLSFVDDDICMWEKS